MVSVLGRQLEPTHITIRLINGSGMANRSKTNNNIKIFTQGDYIMLRRIWPMLLMIILIAGCNESNQAKYEDADFGVSFNYPDDWIVTEQHGAPLWLIASTTEYKPIEGLQGPGVMLFGFKPKDMELVGKWLEEARTEYNNGMELTKSNTSLGGLEAIRYETEVYEENVSQGKFIYYVVEEPEMSFLVQFPYNFEGIYKEEMKKIEEIIKSIKFTKE